MKSRFFGTAVVGLIGAIVGSFSMMLFASSHFANVAGPNDTPPVVSAAPLPVSGGSDQERIINAVKRVEPSVVALNVVINGKEYVPVDPFAQFFGGEGGGGYRNVQQRASGSGFVVSRDGMIVTNAHVVPAGTTSVQAVFANGDKMKARVYSRDPAADIALVKVDGYAKLPPPVEYGDSDRVQAGEWAIAIGEPFELQQSVAVGVVSGFNRNEPIADESGQAREFRGLMQTSAPINPGNSGGPLIDFDGRLIGVNQSTANARTGAQGIGFAIPVNTVRREVALLTKAPNQTLNANVTGTGEGFLGIQPVTVDNDIRSQLNYKGDGVAVGQVTAGTPAAQAGLLQGDVIQKINGQPTTSDGQFRDTISKMKPGTKVNLTVWSQGVEKMVIVTLAEKPVAVQQQDPNSGP
jgi:S1-C subfamily serine protease